MSQPLPAAYAVFKQAFTAVMGHPAFARLTRDVLETTPGGSEAFLQATLPLIQEKTTDPYYNTNVIIQELYSRQAAQIDRYLAAEGAKRRVAFYCPSRAYRQTFGDADARLRERGVRVAKLYSEFADDTFEKSEGAFFASDVVLQKLTKLDYLFLSTLVDFPTPCRRLLSVHDIFDSPLGDEAEFRRMARECDGFFMPSTLGVESMQRVFAPIAKPDDPAAGGKRYVIIRGGYPRLDQNIAYFKANAVQEKTIIYAPTVPLPEWEEYVSVPRWASAIVDRLLTGLPDYRIIFRPHPHSLQNPEIQSLVNRFTPHPRFELDAARGTNYMPTYSRAALMVSDTSGTAYTYSFTTGRPVVFFSPNDAQARAHNPGVRYFDYRTRVGLVAHDLDALVPNVTEALANAQRFEAEAFRLRDEIVFNIGTSSEYFASIAEQLASGEDIPGAIYFRA
jgi:hypothetical protein